MPPVLQLVQAVAPPFKDTNSTSGVYMPTSRNITTKARCSSEYEILLY